MNVTSDDISKKEYIFNLIFVCLFPNSSRPGRPPKRSPGVLQDNAHLLPHSVPGLLSPGLITPTGNKIHPMINLVSLYAKHLK